MKRFVRPIVLLALATSMLAAAAATAAAAPGRPGSADSFATSVPRVEALGVSALAADDDIPGVAMPASPFADSLNGAAGDVYDVYQVPLTAGQTFYTELSNGDTSEFGIFLFAPGSPSISLASDSDLVAYSWFEGPGEAIMYTAEQTGTYYLVVLDIPEVTTGAPGAYTISYGFPSDQPTLNVTMPGPLGFGQSGTATGKLLDAGGVAMADKDVYLYSKAYGAADWSYARSTKTDVNGDFSFTLKPSGKTAYWIWYFGDFTYLDAATTPKWVSVKAWVGNPGAPTTMYVNKAASVWSLLKPRHAAGSYPVRIYKYRYVNGAWKSYGYTNAKAANYSTYTKATASVKLPYAGKWRLRAYHADSGHLATYSSGYDYVTVK